MKKFKYLLLIITILLLLPLCVNAKQKVNIYLFRGEGCPHCQEAEEFFDSIEDKYSKYYNLIDYETWYDSNNADLMQKVAKKLGEEVTGVPYIIIGKKTWKGYDSAMNNEIISAIKSEYNSNNRYDVIKELDKKNKSSVSTDILSVLIIILVVGGITTGIIFARKKAS